MSSGSRLGEGASRCGRVAVDPGPNLPPRPLGCIRSRKHTSSRHAVVRRSHAVGVRAPWYTSDRMRTRSPNAHARRTVTPMPPARQPARPSPQPLRRTAHPRARASRAHGSGPPVCTAGALAPGPRSRPLLAQVTRPGPAAPRARARPRNCTGGAPAAARPARRHPATPLL